MIIIGVYQILSNSALYKNRFFENMNKLKKSDGKCDNQNQYKATLE